jgi:DNA-binding GntR family transcriptional regulator
MTLGAQDAPYAPGSKIGERHSSLRDQVLDALRQRIVNGVYAPGERLTEDRLAGDFGVSRNPIREALRIVEAEGFVHALPRRGVVVATPDRTTMRDMFVVRRQLETLAGGLAAARASAEDVAGLWGLLEEARIATERQDLQAVATLNTMFHQRVVDVADNHWLSTLSAPLIQHVQWVFRLSAAHRAPHSWTEHVRLVEAIEAGDVAAAELAAGQHVDAAAHAAEAWEGPEV